MKYNGEAILVLDARRRTGWPTRLFIAGLLVGATTSTLAGHYLAAGLWLGAAWRTHSHDRRDRNLERWHSTMRRLDAKVLDPDDPIDRIKLSALFADLEDDTP